jgi:two-component system chemotaxis response regulator CheB
MRILIAEDDDALARFVRQGLEGEHYAVDVASDGEQARTTTTENDYDVVILDLNLPKLDGVSVLRHLRMKKPSLPVLVLTQRTRVEDRVQCLDLGADDYVPKHLSSTSLDVFHLREDLVAKIWAAAQSRRASSPQLAPENSSSPSRPEGHHAIPTSPAIVALGTSTGGPKALEEILPRFPRDLPVPILIVQHMPLGFTAPFARRLNALCPLTVREAAHREPVQPGVVYLAPAGMHMTVERSSDSQPLICLDTHPQDAPHTPSVDVLMKSVARAFGNLALGVIMTGMGSDGAEGMKAIYHRGGFTIGQDEASCAVYGMPRACAEAGVLNRVLPLEQIPAQILQTTGYYSRS